MPRKAFERFRNISILYNGTFAFMAGIIAIILLQKGLDLAQLGVYFAIYSLFTLLLEIPTGAFADAYGRKKAIVIAFALQIVFLAGFLLLPNGVIFTAFAIVVAAADAMMSGSAEAYSVDILPKKGKVDYTHKLLSSARSWTFTIMLVGSIVGGYSATFSIDYPIMFCLLFSVAGLFYSWFKLDEPELKKDFKKVERGMIANMSKAFKQSMRNKNLKRIYLLSVLFGLGVYGLFTYWQPVMQEIAGWNTDTLGLFFAVISVMIILGSRTSHYLTANFKNIGLLFFGLSALLFVMCSLNIVIALAVTMLAWEFLWGLHSPLESTIVNQNTTSDIRATAISIKAMAFRLSWVVFGTVIFLTGAEKPREFWLAGAFFLFVGAIIAFRTKE